MLLSLAIGGSAPFLRDLALVLCVAAVTSLVFQRLRQPVVLGYLLAGLLLGPHLLLPLVEDRQTLQTLSELGVTLLMYSLGLEFRLGKLKELGPSAAFVTLLEVGGMLLLGFVAARSLGWSTSEALFTGGALAISSTTLIRKVFGELEVEPRIKELVTGVLIFEDLVAILLIAALTVVANGAQLDLGGLAAVAGRLLLFIVLVLVLGWLLVPRLIAFTIRLGRRETILIAALGLCFAMALIADAAGYSVALGAFLAGSLVAESGHGEFIERRIEPVRDMFLAIFFVSVGMLIDPAQIAAHWPVALALSLLVLFGKVFGVALGAVLIGSDTRTALRVGLSLAQIGEFSFIIAALGAGGGVARDSFYPLIVGVASVAAFSSPILIARSDRIAAGIERFLPRRLSTFASLYGSWLEALRQQSSRDTRWKSARRTIFRVGIDALLFIGLLITGTLVEARLATRLGDSAGLAPELARAVVLVGFLLVCLWPLLGMVRGARRLGAVLAELALPARKGGMDAAQTPRRALSAGLQVAVLLVVALPTLALTEPFLPGFASVGLLALLALLLISMIWRSSADLDGHMRAGAELVLEALAKSGGMPNTRMDLVNELLPGVGDVHALSVGEGHPAVGLTLHEAGLGSACGISVVAIQRGSAQLILPGGNERLQAQDRLAITGSDDAVRS
ncbi:MAG: hypothetical protein RL277_1824, partial [Planctomycetota bacterium]